MIKTKATALARCFLVFVCFSYLFLLSEQESARDPLLQWMDQIAQRKLRERKAVIDQIHAVADADRRKQTVRKRILDLLGGLPDYKGPLNARVTGRLQNDSYTIDKLIYQSLPGLYVTANLYRPNRPGRYPAVLLQAGHTQEGKPEDQRIAANLALKGFVALALTPSVKVKESRRIAGSSKGRWQAGPSLSTSSWEPRRFSLARAQRGTLSGTLCDPWIILRAGPMWTPHVWAPQVALEAGP